MQNSYEEILQLEFIFQKLMINTNNSEYFPGFSHKGNILKLFSKPNNHFMMLLRNDILISFEPKSENAENFKNWLLLHKAMDVKN
ncbi:hypothetical protein ABIB62_004616 [Mucilaginibacter sp. UYP25]